MSAEKVPVEAPDQLHDQEVSARPTKRLFVQMLVRDIELIDAIIDLADNAIDAGLKYRGETKYDGLEAHISISRDRFEIRDNCGGMSRDTARFEAFRFGRVEGHDSVPGAIGQFGVGMKRAIFKLGRSFRFESRTADEHFVVEAGIDVWEKDPRWTFPLLDLPNDDGEAGASLRVTDLHEDVRKSFEQPGWVTRLTATLASRLTQPLHDGFLLTVGGIPVDSKGVSLLSSPELRPSSHVETWEGEGAPLRVQIICGLGPPKRPEEAGWYFHCNGRAIIQADKTELTGWGGDDDLIPQYHPQYSRFRGFVFLSSDSQERLPWNTTKTGVDRGSDVFRRVRALMRTEMRPVIKFLDQVARERRTNREAGSADPGPTDLLLRKAPSTPVAKVATRPNFTVTVPEPPKPEAPLQRITFQRPKILVDAVRKRLKLGSYKEVGEVAFDHLLATEASDLLEE